jgi:hypothetical protein
MRQSRTSWICEGGRGAIPSPYLEGFFSVRGVVYTEIGELALDDIVCYGIIEPTTCRRRSLLYTLNRGRSGRRLRPPDTVPLMRA